MNSTPHCSQNLEYSFSLLEKKITGNRNTFFLDVNAADWLRYLHSPTRFNTENVKGVTWCCLGSVDYLDQCHALWDFEIEFCKVGHNGCIRPFNMLWILFLNTWTPFVPGIWAICFIIVAFVHWICPGSFD